MLIVEKEMGYSHADFFRLLPRAMGDTPYEVRGLEIDCQLRSGSLKISLGDECERRMGLVVIPRTKVTFQYDEVSDEDRAEFLKYFELRFMKGLG